MLNSRPVSMERSSTHSPGDSHKVFLTQFFFTQLFGCLRKSYEGIEKWCEKRLNPCFRDIKPVNEWCYKPEYSPKDRCVENKVPLVSDVDCYDCIFIALFMFTVVKQPRNPFYATGLLLYPLKTSENQRFSCFQGVQKKTSGMKQVIFHCFPRFVEQFFSFISKV